MPAPFRHLLIVLLASGAVAAPAAAQLRTAASQLPRDSPFRGGVPAGVATPGPMALTIGDVLQRALANNLGIVASEADIDHARGTRKSRRATSCPTSPAG